VNLLSRKSVGLAVGVRWLLGIVLVLPGISSSAVAQKFSHFLSLRGSDFFFEAKALPDTVHLLAAMVQFQQDADSRTTGDGRFELFTGKPDSVIDAPPHDRAYFQNHLKFLENYYARVSDGKLIVKTDVLDQLITLSRQMQSYVPQQTGDNTPLARLVDEAWRRADSLMPSVDFSRYQSFAIFHAGVGHDVDLTQILGYDPTPFDIPSLYLGLPALKAVLGPGYQGVPVNGGRVLITNSMLIPESENRLLQDVTGSTLIELSINGLLCASLGSYLGLPDLFDTKSGRSGIGRFGLMDGQGIFSFNGLFPPEPSAWEKIYLGWVTPVIVSPGMSTLTARAVGFHDGLPSVIYKVPINAKEYFLVENRNRDPGQNGQRVKTVINGQVVEKFFLHDTTGFDPNDTSGIHAIKGVVTDVEDYDWSLPGGTDHQRGIFYDGGILIWHIDENVIDANYATNTVNADPNHRGVDLEEADGSQDIGQVYDITQAGSGSENGTALDFWYQGNASPVYTNAFTPTTHPNSLSYSLANSHLYVTDFSSRAPTMTFKVEIGDDFVSPLKGFPKFIGGAGSVGAPIAQDVGCELVFYGNFFVTAGNKVFGFWLDGRSLTSDSSGLFDIKGAAFQPALPFLCSPGPFISFVAGVDDSSVTVWNRSDSDGDGRGDLIFSRSVGHRITTAPTVIPSVGGYNILVGDADGGISFVSRDSVRRIQLFPEVLLPFTRLQPSIPLVAVLNIADAWVGIASAGAASSLGNAWWFGGRSARYAASSDLDGDQVPDIVVVTSDNEILIFNWNSTNVRTLPILSSSGNFSAPAIGDVDADGKKEIVLSRGNKIYAFSIAGNPIDNFPITLPSSAGNPSPPVLARLGTDKKLSVFVGTSSGLVYGFDSQGKILPGFPLAAGGSITNSLALFEEPNFLGILAATDNGNLYAWTLPKTSSNRTIIWGNLSCDPLHSGFEGSSILNPTPLSTQFLPLDRAYNWPNPVYGGSTQIRYFLKSNADVNVKILDLAGDKVAEFAGPGVGGIDNEVSWDVSKVQSGVYIARIEANGSGEHGVALVKIAVVK
jgi:hypothetical protein